MFDDYLATFMDEFPNADSVRVRLRFSKTAIPRLSAANGYVLRKLAIQEDGSVAAEFYRKCADGMKQWILSFGAQVEVLEPNDLRLEIRKEIAQMLLSYVDSTLENPIEEISQGDAPQTLIHDEASEKSDRSSPASVPHLKIFGESAAADFLNFDVPYFGK